MALSTNKYQVGNSVTALNNFVIETPAVPDGTLTVRRGTLGTIGTTVFSVDPNGIFTPVNAMYTVGKSLVGKVLETFDIPSWAKEISIGFNAIQTSGTAVPTLALGDEDGIETSGYGGTVATTSSTSIGSGSINSLTGFPLANGTGNSASIASGVGHLLCSNSDGLNWNYSALTGQSDTARFSWTAGRKALDKRLTTIRLITSNGSDTFIGNSSMSVTIKG